MKSYMAHPKVKLFITHCGVSSTYETVQHAIPIVANIMAYSQIQNGCGAELKNHQ